MMIILVEGISIKALKIQYVGGTFVNMAITYQIMGKQSHNGQIIASLVS